MIMTDAGPFNFSFLEQYGVPLRRFKAGEVLFSVGEPGNSMLLVVEGKIDVKVGGETVETVGLHGVVGEMALIDKSPRSATAVGATGGEVAVIDRDVFLTLVGSSPAFSLYVMKLMAARIRKMNAQA
jgi:CRP/FNR family transcriptional regulator, cyclic AMP receptor protein